MKVEPSRLIPRRLLANLELLIVILTGFSILLQSGGRLQLI